MTGSFEFVNYENRAKTVCDMFKLELTIEAYSILKHFKEILLYLRIICLLNFISKIMSNVISEFMDACKNADISIDLS